MNIRLSTAANKVEGKNCALVEKGGSLVNYTIFTGMGSSLKGDMLECLYRGLMLAKPVVCHDDTLVIEVQNRHLALWLQGREESKGYEEGLDKVYSVLESLDCRYQVVFQASPYAKTFMKGKDVIKPSLSGLADIMADI